MSRHKSFASYRYKRKPDMNQYLFAIRNISDKIIKIINNWSIFRFYLETYVFSRLDRIKPDIYIVSYPKCGRTWLRVMLQRYLEQQLYTPPKILDKSIIWLPDGRLIKFEHDQGSWVLAPPKLDRLSFNHEKYHDKKIIFFIRDPRDILISSWYHLKYRENIYRKGISDFINDDLVGMPKIIAFMNMWIDNKKYIKEFFLKSYEELHNDPSSCFRDLLKFMAIPIEPEYMEIAIQESSFNKMKKLETNGFLREPWMKPGSKNSKDSMKIRKGRIGGYLEELSKEDIELINSIIYKDLTPKLPYH